MNSLKTAPMIIRMRMSKIPLYKSTIFPFEKYSDLYSNKLVLMYRDSTIDFAMDTLSHGIRVWKIPSYSQRRVFDVKAQQVYAAWEAQRKALKTKERRN